MDAAALAAASAVPRGNWSTVIDRAAKFNPGGTNPGTGNNYLDSPHNQISQKNVTLVKYDNGTKEFTTSGVNINNANGARVALENNNPYGGSAGKAMKSPLFLAPLFNLFGQPTKTTADVSVSAVAVNQALPGLPIVVVQGLCGSTDATLDFQSGGKSTAGWETYQISNASTDEIRALFEKLPYCAGQPEIDVGYCGNIANGVNETIYNGHIKPMFEADPNACYLIPVIKSGGNLNQCQTITDWASFCPHRTNPHPGPGLAQGKCYLRPESLDLARYGNVTCSAWFETNLRVCRNVRKVILSVSRYFMMAYTRLDDSNMLHAKSLRVIGQVLEASRIPTFEWKNMVQNIWSGAIRYRK